MSDTVGSIIESTDRTTGESSRVDGIVEPEIGSVGSESADRRPPGVIDGYETINPVTERFGSGTDSSDSVKRTKSGRIDRRTKAGRSGETTSDLRSAPISSSGKLISLTDAILSLHDMAAGLFEIDELVLTEDEAKKYSDVVQDVSKYHMASFNPKHVAYVNMAAFLAGIYGTRIMAYRRRTENERKQKPQLVPKSAPKTQAKTLEEYLGGMPPVEGAGGF